MTGSHVGPDCDYAKLATDLDQLAAGYRRLGRTRNRKRDAVVSLANDLDNHLHRAFVMAGVQVNFIVDVDFATRYSADLASEPFARIHRDLGTADELAVRILVGAGLRESELCGLAIVGTDGLPDLMLDPVQRGRVELRVRWDAGAKGKKSRRVPIATASLG